MPTYQEMSRFGKAAMEYLEQKGLPKTSENFSNAVDLAKQGMLPKEVTSAPVSSWDDLLEPNKKPENNIQWATNPVSNTQKVTTPATASTVASAKQVLNPLDKETNYVLSNPKFGGKLGKNINNATDEEIAAARQTAQANLDVRNGTTAAPQATAPKPQLSREDKEVNFLLSSATPGKNIFNSTPEEIEAVRDQARANIAQRDQDLTDAQTASAARQRQLQVEYAFNQTIDWAKQNQIPLMGGSIAAAGLGTSLARNSNDTSAPATNPEQVAKAQNAFDIDDQQARMNRPTDYGPAYLTSEDLSRIAAAPTSKFTGMATPPAATVNNAKQVMSRNTQPLIDLNTKNSGEQASVPSARALWDIYNQTGSAADFVRASNAQKLEDPGNAKFEAAANEKRGGSVSGKGKDGGMNPKEAVLHKALEIIHHMISRGR